MSNQVLLFLIVGKNEPLYEAEIHKRGATGNSDAVARQSYFVVHSSLDLVEKTAWVTQNVRTCVDDSVGERNGWKCRLSRALTHFVCPL